jgi:hypothetical protein
VSGHGRAGHSLITGTTLTQIQLEHFPGTAAQFGQQCAVEHKIDPQPRLKARCLKYEYVICLPPVETLGGIRIQY